VGSTETPENIIKSELKKNRALMDMARKRLEVMIPDTTDPEVIAKILDILARANAAMAKFAAAGSRAEEATMTPEQLTEFLKKGQL